MIITTLKLKCDDCATAPFSGAEGTTAADLRRAAKRAGWRKRLRPNAHGESRAVDLCPACVAKGAS